MNGYCHTRTFDLRYTDLDFRDELKLSSLLSFAQDAAASSADELGFGYEALKQKEYGFIVVGTAGELFAPVSAADRLTVETWPLPPRHVIFERDYRVTNQRGEIVALLASRWCLVDLPRFIMLPPEALGKVHEDCPYNPEQCLPFPNGRIRLTDGREVCRTVVRSSDCDHYLHANNTHYADFFMNCFTLDELAPVRSFRISYGKQAKEGTELVFYRGDGAGESTLEARCGEECHAGFYVKFREGKR